MTPFDVSRLVEGDVGRANVLASFGRLFFFFKVKLQVTKCRQVRWCGP